MSILRIQHNKENPYVMLNKSVLEEKNLSWAAKGLWSYLMSRPDNWAVSVNQLKTIFKGNGGGRDAIYSILKELIDNGYCEKVQLKVKGRFSNHEYIISEFKKSLPQTAFPEAVAPLTANGDANNNRVQQSTEIDFDKDNVCGTMGKTMPYYPKKNKYEKVDPCIRWRLNHEQAETFYWLQALNINTDEGTLAFWSKSYSLNRLHEIYECAKQHSKSNIGGYMNRLLKKFAIVENSQSRTNKESAIQFIKETNSRNIEVLEKYIKISLINGFIEEIPYNIDPMDFYRKLLNLNEM